MLFERSPEEIQIVFSHLKLVLERAPPKDREFMLGELEKIGLSRGVLEGHGADDHCVRTSQPVKDGLAENPIEKAIDTAANPVPKEMDPIPERSDLPVKDASGDASEAVKSVFKTPLPEGSDPYKMPGFLKHKTSIETAEKEASNLVNKYREDKSQKVPSGRYRHDSHADHIIQPLILMSVFIFI